MPERMPEWMRDMTRAVDDKLVADLVSDARAHNVIHSNGPVNKVTVQGAGAVVTGTDGAAHRGSGWSEPPSIDSWKPPGLEIMDAMVDEQDRIDRAKRALELGQAAHVNKQLKSKS
jgi:hypothetical protein